MDLAALRFIPASKAGTALKDLLAAYYREGEDADTPQETLDAFIAYLRELVRAGTLQGEVAFDGARAQGFVLYAFDGDGYPFPERSMEGTIVELGVIPEARGSGLGRMLVRHAEDALHTWDMYVCVHPNAQGFWRKCGYQPTGDIASNGLPIYIKRP